RREFTGAPIEDDVLQRVLLAAHAAPSVGMSQPWDFVLVRSPDNSAANTSRWQDTWSRNARSVSGERAATFERIKIEGICESGLGIVVGYDPTRGGPQVLGRHA
ncbi:5,6-dimethylbenzimidazole synthase, partial [Mycobacterium sp. ITM-2017-0098]